MTEPWPGVFGTALETREMCTVHGLSRRPQTLPIGAWRAHASSSDRVLLRHCVGATLDVGCGPGRMTAMLVRNGHRALGIDVVPEAVAQASRRGVPALLCDVLQSRVPGAGTWATVLLADGNLGIGGDPGRLLRRAAMLLEPGGRVVADLAPPGAGLRRSLVTLECDGRRSSPFPWATVGAECVAELSVGAGLRLSRVRQHEGRWFAVLLKGSS